MSACVHCDSPAVVGDPLRLCRAHGGLAWIEFEDTWRDRSAA